MLLFFPFYCKGTIRCFSLPTNIDDFHKLEESRKELSFSWPAHTDVIWQLKHHPYDQKLLSLSADGSVKMWKSLSYWNDAVNKRNLTLEML